MLLKELSHEMEAKITALHSRNIMNDEDYYRIKALVDHPEAMKGLEVDTLVVLFNELRINNSCEKISYLTGVSKFEVFERIQKVIGVNVADGFYNSVTSVYRNL